MRISDWSSDVCSSDLPVERFTSNIHLNLRDPSLGVINLKALSTELDIAVLHDDTGRIREEAVNNGLSRVLPFDVITSGRSEEHTSELQSLMRISYAVFCLKKKKYINQRLQTTQQTI